MPGFHPSAVDFFLLAVRRGLPIFNEGYSSLLSRLRNYSLYGDKLLPDGYMRDDLEKSFKKIQKWSFAVNHSALALTLKDISLIDEDIGSDYITNPESGWRIFKPLRHPPINSDDYWDTDF